MVLWDCNELMMVMLGYVASSLVFSVSGDVVSLLVQVILWLFQTTECHLMVT
jgi:hypothetical protein